MSATFTTNAPRGGSKQFYKGMAKLAGSGRKKGVVNTSTKDVKAGILMAAAGIGGVPRLIAWDQGERAERVCVLGFDLAAINSVDGSGFGSGRRD
jgi:hypothetical protein